LAPAKTASAQTKLTMGKVIGGDGFHIPTYVALDEDFFKAEGLDATLVELPPSSIVSAVSVTSRSRAPPRTTWPRPLRTRSRSSAGIA